MSYNRVASFAAESACAARELRRGRESLAARSIHLWLADITQPLWARIAEQTLHPAELSRARRFGRSEDAQRFVHGRAVLRQLLARYLNCDARDLVFEYGPAGKPLLASACAGNGVRFNISHSGQWALIAVARGAEVGVDIEHMRGDFDVLPLAREYFSAAEASACDALTGAAQRDRFYRLWVCKEACLKGSGAGIAEDLARLDMSLILRETQIEIEHANRRWTVVSLDGPAGYAAAVAVDAIAPKLSLRLVESDVAGAEVAFA